MTNRSYLAWGAWVALALPLLVLVASAAWLAFSYDGKCGGLLPELSAVRACSIEEYVAGSLVLLTLILWNEFWPFVILVLAIPIGIGYAFDRRRRHRKAR